MSEHDVRPIVGSSAAIQAVRELVTSVAPSDIPVLLVGETGTGKEHIARYIHAVSQRKGPFVAMNLASVSDELAAAELFGVRRGAFTGAESRAGVIAAANGGTLLLDELDSATPQVQSILTRFVSSRSVRPVGGEGEFSVDVRLIATAADANSLRADLRYAVGGVLIRLPPLREHREDIPALAEQILKELGHPQPLDDETIAELQRYSFPGNVRELQSVLRRSLIVAGSSPITVEHVRRTEEAETSPANPATLQRDVENLRSQISLLRQFALRANPIWEGREFDVERDYCFVLMPFSEDYDVQRVYNDHVKPVVERCKMRCERADDIHDISGVMQSVWESMNRARLVIAEMTGRNPNVFYELGIAHTLGKPVIMITQSMDHVPFDLKHLRCIVYDYKPGSIAKFEHRC